MGYSGLTFGLGSLAGDVYINNVIGSSVEIVSYFIAFLVIPGGRKCGNSGVLIDSLADLPTGLSPIKKLFI